MTVRIITDIQKNIIVHQYTFMKIKVKELAADYKVSRRTIQRVLVEKGVAPVRKPKAVPLYTQQTELHITMVEPTFMEKAKGFFKSIFSSKQQQTNVQASK
jgi:phage antirepressor YoqD-like protein